MQETKQEDFGKEIGKITHYYDKISVAVVELSGTLKVGDKIRIKGNFTDFEQNIDSMQIEHEQMKVAKKGQAIGLKVDDKVREHDIVYKI